MPRVLTYTPGWLTRPSKGFDLFHAQESSSAQRQPESSGPAKTIAQRGTEVFVAVGTELRWGDLSLLQDAADETTHADQVSGYRLLKTACARPITQLSISPDGNLLAILTTHTCHVCVLPTSSHLRSGDFTPLRLKTFQIGPITHVLEQALLATAIWHPLSPPGVQCLVTITKDACVRLWELSLNNRYSFDQPALAVDLKKLANATSIHTDLSASRFGASRGFSPDEVEMEVAAACFGGQARNEEHGWASMTLWIAMTEGDVYALCPFLPSKFCVATTTLPSLTTSVIARSRFVAADNQATEAEKRMSDTQSLWLADLDNQEPLIVAGQNEFDEVEVYARPERPGAIPKLQGPIQLNADLHSVETTDIHVIAPSFDETELFGDDEQLDGFSEVGALSIGIVSLATRSGDVHICLDLVGVEAVWLPEKRSRAFALDDAEDSKELLLFQTVALSNSTKKQSSWTTFTTSPVDRYELLVTSSTGITGLDFKPWTSLLENELANAGESGIDFRLNVFLESAETRVDTLITTSSSETGVQPTPVVASLSASLGYLVLTSTPAGPQTATLEIALPHAHPYIPDQLALPPTEPRESYQPAEEFFSPGTLHQFLESKLTNPISRNDLTQPIRTRPEVLQLLTDAHRILSNETHRLGVAAADLFRRCERMRIELGDQVSKISELSVKTASITGADEIDDTASDEEEDRENLGANAKIEQRVTKAQSETLHLNERVEDLRRKMLRLGGAELSTKEHAYAKEVERLADIVRTTNTPAMPVSPTALLKLPDHEGESEDEHSEDGALTQRLVKAFDMKDHLVDMTDTTLEKLKEARTEPKRGAPAGSEYKKQKLAYVMELMERETALVDAVTDRLKRLGGLEE